MGGGRWIMPRGKTALVKSLNSKSAIQKKQKNQKLQARKAAKAAKKGGVISADGKSKMFTQRGHEKEDKALTKAINRRISQVLHARSAKRGSGFAVVKTTDFDE